jgi:hypothetical protein
LSKKSLAKIFWIKSQVLDLIEKKKFTKKFWPSFRTQKFWPKKFGQNIHPNYTSPTQLAQLVQNSLKNFNGFLNFNFKEIIFEF